MGLPFFKSVQKEGVDGVNSQRAGVDFSRMGFLQSVFVGVIDSSIKSHGDASTDSEIRIFLRKFRRRIRGFSENAFSFVKRYLTKLIARGGHHLIYTSLADKRKVRRRFLCFSENACSFVKRAAPVTTFAMQKSKSRSFRNRRDVCRQRVKEQYHHFLFRKSLYLSTFISYGKADLKKMPTNSLSPLRAHSQQSLLNYSKFSSSPKMIPDTWSTYDPGGNTCADSFTASSKAKVSHIIKVKSKCISYHALSLSFSLSLFLLAWQSERSNQPALGVSLPIWSQLPGLYS